MEITITLVSNGYMVEIKNSTSNGTYVFTALQEIELLQKVGFEILNKKLDIKVR